MYSTAVAEDAWAMVATGDATLTVTADVTLHADPGRLKTLFENLFRNAVEHGSTTPNSVPRSQIPEDAVKRGSPGEQPAADDGVEGATGTRPLAGDGVARPDDTGHRHSDDPIPVDVTVGPLADGSGFYVEDTGGGIPPDHRERVFEAAFTTGDGSGLGLAIVRAAADAHGWSHRVTEGEYGGARFEFRNVSFVDDD